jgi:polyisoprenoid-binding protein YceI
VLNGTDVTVTGRTDRVEGVLTIGAEGLTLEAAELTVDVASISTDSNQRDAYFRDQALRTGEFPTATFVLTEPVSLEEAPDAGAVVQAEVTGELTLAGATQSVTATVQVRSDGSTAEIAGTIPITFADFGVEAPSLGFVSVEPTGFVEFQLTAARQ